MIHANTSSWYDSLSQELERSSASIEKRFTLLNKIYSKSAMLHGKIAALNAEKTAKETFIDGIAGKDLPVINLKKNKATKLIF